MGMLKRKRQFSRIFVLLCLLSLAIYGFGRLYFRLTGGFRESNIISDFAFDPRWQTRPLNEGEQLEVDNVLDQEYRYLGKGCQSYVFVSQDGQYVIKFFKYQRFRPQFYINWFSFVPQIEAIREQKIEKKRKKREDLFNSWKVAYDNLQDESGLVYVHLNKTDNLNKTLIAFDKIGLKHTIDMDQMEFLIQRKATMLCHELDRLVAIGDVEKAKKLISNLIDMVVFEYNRGLADNDHALMQNTGVIEGKPIHVDVGQFVIDYSMKDPAKYSQELYNKTYKFRLWRQEKHPELLVHLESELIAEMGDNFYKIKYIPKVR